MDANKHPLRIMRDRYNLSIAALERATGVSKRTIIRIQQGYSTYPETRRELCDYFTKLTGTQITSQQLGLIIESEPIPQTEENEDMKRRQLLQTIILGGATLALSPQEAIDRLVHAQIAPSEMNEDTLAYFAKLNENCWHITNGSELASIEQVLPTYVPQLAIVAQQQSQHQREAANLTSQGYLLAGLVALDQLNFPAMERHSQLAVHYSELAGDYNLHAAALKQQATMFLISKEPDKALQAYRKALPFINKISPLLRSRIYQGLANASSRCELESDALHYLNLAYKTFPSDFEHDPSFLYADSGLSVLYMYDGLTHLDLNQPSKAWEAFEKVEGLDPKIPIGETTQLEFINLQGKTAVMLRDKERSHDYIEAAVTKADALNCRWGRTEAFEIYQQARLIWPNEPQIKTLAQAFRSTAR